MRTKRVGNIVLRLISIIVKYRETKKIKNKIKKKKNERVNKTEKCVLGLSLSKHGIFNVQIYQTRFLTRIECWELFQLHMRVRRRRTIFPKVSSPVDSSTCTYGGVNT